MDFNARVVSIVMWLSLISNLLLVCYSDQSDVNCLKSIKESLEDPFNYLTSSWDFTNKSEGSICKFAGVDCWNPDENRVGSIKLRDMGLVGEFPHGVANCTSLVNLDLSNNKLSGSIPRDVFPSLPYVVTLDLSGNNFSGEIPPGIANLSFLNSLRLDRNQLTGQIPPDLGLLRRLNTANFANNRLSGQVPNLTVSAGSYANNLGLCGGPLPPCDEYRVFFLSGFAVGWSAFTVLVFSLSLLYLPNNPLRKFNMILTSTRNKKKINRVLAGQESQWPTTNRSEDSKISKLEKLVTRMSSTELVKATDNFSDANIIRVGKTGTMYKANLSNGRFLAIKRFYDSECYNGGHFITELMTLGRLRHTNVVTLLGFCYETKEKVLVYKYMSNGNLYDWLHRRREGDHAPTKMMKWPRVKIAVGIARGLAWLHHNTKFQVFHNNLSSKSILLDHNFEPKISNFGEATSSSPDEVSVGGSSSTIGEISQLDYDKKDVYSFGVVLLELITGKEPSVLVDWIVNLSNSTLSLCDVVDNPLIGLRFDGEILQFLDIARKCVSANERPTMLEVYHEMRPIGEKRGVIVVDADETSKQSEITFAREEDEIH